jgi:hypothetical protein
MVLLPLTLDEGEGWNGGGKKRRIEPSLEFIFLSQYSFHGGGCKQGNQSLKNTLYVGNRIKCGFCAACRVIVRSMMNHTALRNFLKNGHWSSFSGPAADALHSWSPPVRDLAIVRNEGLIQLLAAPGPDGFLFSY